MGYSNLDIAFTFEIGLRFCFPAALFAALRLQRALWSELRDLFRLQQSCAAWSMEEMIIIAICRYPIPTISLFRKKFSVFCEIFLDVLSIFFVGKISSLSSSLRMLSFALRDLCETAFVRSLLFWNYSKIVCRTNVAIACKPVNQPGSQSYLI
jgi:hypothetical protein